ncbi:MAG TPA: hypothetical protein VK923_13180 [Euzebyales bacterium]|nr:hypothetical protein [Euzebyales bacterium]
MSCPTDELLRAHLDAADERIARHVDGCGACAGRLAAVADNARFTARAVADLGAESPRAHDVEVDAAWRAIGRSPTRAPRRLRLPIGIAAGVVALLVAGLAVFTPTGRQAAADFLEGFRSERFEVVTFDPDQSMADLDQLAEIVDVDTGGRDMAGPEAVDTLAQAAEVSGFEPTDVGALPDDATLDGIVASPPDTARLTLRGDRAPDLPPALDGAQLVVSIPGAVASTYDVEGDQLMVGEAGQLAVEAQGAELGAIREYLLSRPEVPEDLARQLTEIDDWTSTVPVPVPVDTVVWEDTTVGGAPALMLDDAAGSGLLWQADGRIHAVGAEGLDIDVLRDVADGIG